MLCCVHSHTCIQVASVLGKEKLCVLSGMGKKELEGGETRGAAAEPLQSSPFSGQPMQG